MAALAFVMPGLVPGTHVAPYSRTPQAIRRPRHASSSPPAQRRGVGGRNKSGHDDLDIKSPGCDRPAAMPPRAMTSPPAARPRWMLRRWLPVLLGCALMWMLPAVARAQPIDLSGGGPIDVTAAGGFEWRQNEQKVIANGDARAVRGDVTVIADHLIAYYRKKAPPPGATPVAATTPAPSGGITDDESGDNEVYRLEAIGNVRIFTPTDYAVGDRAIYDIDQAVLVMTGKAMKITTPQQVMTARDTMEYWSQKHMAVGRGDAVVVTTDARRIAGDVLVGYTDDTNAPRGAAPAKPATATAPGAAGDPANATGKLKRVEAYGNVEVRTTADIVRGDRGLYLADTGMARVVGHVRITHGQNQVNGPAADVNMKTGIANIVSNASERVTGLIIPNDAQNPDKKPAGAAK
jgi:lipopolysaccharide export system protein LptA